jgi:hydrogenase maturation protease
MKNLKTNSNKILLIGIGNSGRGDDGLGWKFTELVAHTLHDFFDCEDRYQLQIEDSELISKYESVIFVDASHAALNNGFEIIPCTAAGHYYYSSHMQSPETILYLTNELYRSYPKAYTLGISGQIWELKTSLSKTATKNLQSAFAFFEEGFLHTLQYPFRVN